MECSVKDCNRIITRTNLCNGHYLRLRRYGSVYGGKQTKKISCNHFDKQGILINWQHPLYNTYVGMLSRCNDIKNVKYPLYGGRGIKVCREWQGECGLHRFIDDMGERPNNCSLDRKNGNKNYTASNCKWATIHEQNSNKKTNRKIVGVYPANDNRKLKWRTRFVVNGIELAGRAFATETEAAKYIMKLREDNNIYVG